MRDRGRKTPLAVNPYEEYRLEQQMKRIARERRRMRAEAGLPPEEPLKHPMWTWLKELWLCSRLILIIIAPVLAMVYLFKRFPVQKILLEEWYTVVTVLMLMGGLLYMWHNGAFK